MAIFGQNFRFFKNFLCSGGLKLNLRSGAPPKPGLLIPKIPLKLRLDIPTRSSGYFRVDFGQKVKGSYLRPLDPKKLFFKIFFENMGIGIKWAKKSFLTGKIAQKPL